MDRTPSRRPGGAPTSVSKLILPAAGKAFSPVTSAKVSVRRNAGTGVENSENVDPQLGTRALPEPPRSAALSALSAAHKADAELLQCMSPMALIRGTPGSGTRARSVTATPVAPGMAHPENNQGATPCSASSFLPRTLVSPATWTQEQRILEETQEAGQALLSQLAAEEENLEVLHQQLREAVSSACDAQQEDGATAGTEQHVKLLEETLARERAECEARGEALQRAASEAAALRAELADTRRAVEELTRERDSALQGGGDAGAASASGAAVRTTEEPSRLPEEAALEGRRREAACEACGELREELGAARKEAGECRQALEESRRSEGSVKAEMGILQEALAQLEEQLRASQGSEAAAFREEHSVVGSHSSGGTRRARGGQVGIPRALQKKHARSSARQEAKAAQARGGRGGEQAGTTVLDLIQSLNPFRASPSASQWGEGGVSEGSGRGGASSAPARRKRPAVASPGARGAHDAAYNAGDYVVILGGDQGKEQNWVAQLVSIKPCDGVRCVRDCKGHALVRWCWLPEDVAGREVVCADAPDKAKRKRKMAAVDLGPTELLQTDDTDDNQPLGAVVRTCKVVHKESDECGGGGHDYCFAYKLVGEDRGRVKVAPVAASWDPLAD